MHSQGQHLIYRLLMLSKGDFCAALILISEINTQVLLSAHVQLHPYSTSKKILVSALLDVMIANIENLYTITNKLCVSYLPHI